MTNAPDGFQGKLNIYTCDACRGHIVTRDVDQGVTPFMTDCKATKDCKGAMKSSMYRVFDQSMAESHQWFRPTPETWITYPRHTRDHLENGGLLLREASEPAPYHEPEIFVPPRPRGGPITSAELMARARDLKARMAEAELGSKGSAEEKIDALSRQRRRALEREERKPGGPR